MHLAPAVRFRRPGSIGVTHPPSILMDTAQPVCCLSVIKWEQLDKLQLDVNRQKREDLFLIMFSPSEIWAQKPKARLQTSWGCGQRMLRVMEMAHFTKMISRISLLEANHVVIQHRGSCLICFPSLEVCSPYGSEGPLARLKASHGIRQVLDKLLTPCSVTVLVSCTPPVSVCGH